MKHFTAALKEKKLLFNFFKRLAVMLSFSIRYVVRRDTDIEHNFERE